MIVNNEFERMWKKTVVASFKVLLQNLHGGTEEIQTKCKLLNIDMGGTCSNH